MGTDGVASRSGFPAPRRDRRCAFRRDERGAVAVVTGLVLTALVGMAAMVVDVGLAWYRHSQLQAAADMAALSATFSLSPAATAAANQAATDASVVNALAGNGFAGTTHATAVGSYDPTAVLGSRLAIGSGTMNAVQVSAQSTSPVLFGRIFGGGSTIPLGVTSAATRVDLAGLTAGTTLATLDTTQSALLNALLGQALGSSVALSAASYKGLMGATVSMANLLPALATQANLTAGTYGQLAGASLTVGQLARAALSAAQADGTLTTSLAATLNGLSAAPGALAVPLSRLFSLAAYAYQPIGSALTSSALAGNLDLFTLLDDAAAIAAGSGPLTIAPSVAGISAVSVQAAVGQPAQSSPFGTFSPVGTGVQTAQVRLQVTLTLANVAAGALLNQTLTVPVYVEAAKGIATLSAISCGRNPRTDAVVTVGGTTGTATAAIGTVSSGGLANFAATPTLQPATILSTSVAGVVKPVAVTASGTTTVLPGKGTLSFTQAQIAQTPPVVQTISANQVLVSPALYNAVQFGSLPSTISAADLLKALKPILGDGTNPGVLDTIVSSALGAFGIRLGAMDVTVPGVRCGVPVLVQ